MNDLLAPLRRTHSDETLTQSINRFSLEFWRTQDTPRIIESLRPGTNEALRIKSDGRIMNGNVRHKVLEERGFDPTLLEREIV